MGKYGLINCILLLIIIALLIALLIRTRGCSKENYNGGAKSICSGIEGVNEGGQPCCSGLVSVKAPDGTMYCLAKSGPSCLITCQNEICNLDDPSAIHSQECLDMCAASCQA
jgi:hypothetical protein